MIKTTVTLLILSCGIICATDPTNTIFYTEIQDKKVMGPLGHPLGDYITIEGRPGAVGFGGEFEHSTLEDVSKFGVHSLEVLKVDGVKLKKPIIIQFKRNAKYEPSDYYVIRGYQTGEFGPGDVDPNYPDDPAPQTIYHFYIRFIPTRNLSAEKKIEPTAPAKPPEAPR
jgi:hypothetical protein